MRDVTTTIRCFSYLLFFLFGSTGFTSIGNEHHINDLNNLSIDSEVIVYQVDEFAYEFKLDNKISKDKIAFYQRRLNHGVRFAQSVGVTKKSCRIVFRSGSTEDEILQGITFAIKTFSFKTFKITTHE